MAALVSYCDDSALVSDAPAGSSRSAITNSRLVENDLVHFESSEKRKIDINDGVDSNRFFQFKKLKVSAVRDFPAGCGRFPQKNSPTTSQIDVDMEAIAEKLTVKISMDSSSTSHHVQQETTVEKDGQFNKSSLDAVVMEHLEPLKILQPEHAGGLASAMIDLYPLHTPKYVAYVDPFASVSLPEYASVNDLVQEKTSSQSDNSKSLRETCTAAKKMNEADDAGMENKSNNFPVRPVSVNRSSHSEEQTLSGTTDREISDTLEKRLANESAASAMKEVDSSKLSIKPVGMNPNEDQCHKRDPTDLELFKGKVVVLALMAAQNCPWMQGIVSDEAEGYQ